MNFAGVNCYDWSSMGSQNGWLGKSAFCFLQYMLERKLSQEDVIILECTCGFEDSCLTDLLGDTHELKTFCLSPTMLG